MSKVTIDDRLPQFSRSLENMLDSALRSGARDILIDAKNNAPFKKGHLRSDSSVKKNERLSYRISFFKEYARFQEFGGDGKRTVRNYTTAGTRKRYLSRAGDDGVKRLQRTIKTYAKRARA